MNTTLLNLMAAALTLLLSISANSQNLNAGSTEHLGKYTNYTFPYPNNLTENDVAAFAVNADRQFFTYFKNGLMSQGNLDGLDSINGPAPYYPEDSQSPDTILAISFLPGSTSEVITWYKDMTYSLGNARFLGHSRTGGIYKLATGYSPSDVAGIGIHNENGRTYAWYKDGTYSIGQYFDLAYYSGTKPYVIQQGLGDIIGMDFLGTDGSTASLHKAKPVYRIQYSVGESNGLDSHQGLRHIKLPDGKKPDDILAMAVFYTGREDHIFTWYKDFLWTRGSYTDLDKYDDGDFMILNDYPISDIMGIGINGDEVTYTYYKNGYGMVGDIEELSGLATFQFSPAHGRIKESIIGIGIESYTNTGVNSRVNAWYNDNGGNMPAQASQGTYDQLGNFRPIFNVSIPEGKSTQDIIDVGLSIQDTTVTWYKLY